MDLRPHEQFMRRCLDLAARGEGHTLSNPMVGAVIVSGGEIIAEGWHQKYGEAHAERNAILSVQQQSKLAGASIYVNLEPCAHHGKTPPCSALIAASGIGTVVYGMRDPFAEVNGKGLQYLQENGVQVIGPVLENECRWLNRRFETFYTKNRPYVVLKWAQSADGFMAPESRERVQISGETSRILLHQWRAQEMAVLVGAGTVAADKPELTVRFWQGETGYRIFLDGTLKNTYAGGFGKTIVYNHLQNQISGEVELVKTEAKNMLPELLADMQQRKIISVLVEGGYQTLQYFLEAGIWDEIRIIQSKKVRLEHGLKTPNAQGNLFDQMDLGTDKVLFYRK